MRGGFGGGVNFVGAFELADEDAGVGCGYAERARDEGLQVGRGGGGGVVHCFVFCGAGVGWRAGVEEGRILVALWWGAGSSVVTRLWTREASGEYCRQR